MTVLDCVRCLPDKEKRAFYLTNKVESPLLDFLLLNFLSQDRNTNPG